MCVCLGLCVVVVAIVVLSRGCTCGWVGHRHQPSVLWMCVGWVCGCVDGWVIMFVVMAMFVVVVGVVVVVCVSFSDRIRVCGCVCSVCSVCSV